MESVLADDLEQQANQTLTPEIYDFIAGGAGGEQAIAANRHGFDRFRLRPRVLTGVAAPSTAVTLFNRQLAAPLFVAPMGTHQIVHPDGELATARAATTAGIGYITSSSSSFALEVIADVAPPAHWFQLYFLRDRKITADLIRRAGEANCAALCLTVDVPITGRRPRDVRNDFSLEHSIRRVNLDRYGLSTDRSGKRGNEVVDRIEGSLTWGDLGWIRTITDLPLVLKGIMTAEDARRAADAGVDGIVVSNHGGRQLGRVIATISALDEIVSAVGGELPVVLDGGVRSAEDVVTALALGATAVGIGRPVLWALASGGEELVERFFRDLVTDLERTLILLGRESVRALDSAAVSRTDPDHAPTTA